MTTVSQKIERFLSAQDHCRFATVGRDGFPHIVPVGYFYHDRLIYIPTSLHSRKARNLDFSPKCSIIVDVYDGKKGRGVMLQGEGRTTKHRGFLRAKTW